MKIKTETSIIIALTTIKLFEFNLKGKKASLLRELTSKDSQFINEVKCNCIIEKELPVSVVLTKLMGGVTKIVKEQIGNLTKEESALLMRLLQNTFNEQLYIVIDEEYTELNM